MVVVVVCSVSSDHRVFVCFDDEIFGKHIERSIDRKKERLALSLRVGWVWFVGLLDVNSS